MRTPEGELRIDALDGDWIKRGRLPWATRDECLGYLADSGRTLADIRKSPANNEANRARHPWFAELMGE